MIGQKIGSVSPDGVVVIRTGDEMEIQTKLPPGEEITSTFVQIYGSVTGNTSMEATAIIPLSENFDLETYNAAVDMMQTDTHRGLFMS